MISELFLHLLNYDPDTIEPALREKMASIARARAEFLTASAGVAQMRARAWAGEKGVNDLAEIKAPDLTKLRMDYMMLVRDLLKEAVDLDSLAELVPMIVGGVLQSVKVPLPVLMEGVGLDLDQIKLAASSLKEMFEEL